MPSDLALLNEQNQYIIPSGRINVSVGGMQPSEKSIASGKVMVGKTMINVSNGDFFQLNKIQ
jgi:hypothetical protein